MVLSNPKILIASDGDKTYAIVNGLPLRCEELTFHTDGCDVSFSVQNVHAGKAFSGDEFIRFIEDKLGYKLSAE